MFHVMYERECDRVNGKYEMHQIAEKTLKMLHLLLYAMPGTFLSEPRLYYVVTMASSIDDSCCYIE